MKTIECIPEPSDTQYTQILVVFESSDFELTGELLTLLEPFLGRESVIAIKARIPRDQIMVPENN